MLCPANMLGYLHAIRLARAGAHCGVRELAPAVCRPGLPGRAPRIHLGTPTCPERPRDLPIGAFASAFVGVQAATGGRPLACTERSECALSAVGEGARMLGAIAAIPVKSLLAKCLAFNPGYATADACLPSICVVRVA